MKRATTTRLQKRQAALACSLAALAAAACAASPIEAVLIHPQARDVQRHAFPESKSRQVSYRVQLQYPQTAVSGANFKQLEELGWTRCSGPPEGWDNYIDASKGEDRKEAVFQNLSHWSKGEALLTIVMRYYADVTDDRRRLDAPGNTEQHVVVLEDNNPDVKKSLNISCEVKAG